MASTPPGSPTTPTATRDYPSSTGKGWKIVLGILGALLVLFFIAELGARMLIAQQVKSSFKDSSPEAVVSAEEPDVHFGASPVVIGLLSNKLAHISIDVPSTLTPNSEDISGIPATNIEADGFVLNEEDPTADKVVLHTQLPQVLVRNMLQEELNRSLTQAEKGYFGDVFKVSDVQTNPGNNTFTITVSDGMFDVELRPEVVDGTLGFTAQSTKALGYELPDVFSEQISKALKDSLADGIAGPLEVRDFTVVDGAFEVVISGENVHLNELMV